MLAPLVKEAALEKSLAFPLNAFGPALPHNTQGDAAIMFLACCCQALATLSLPCLQDAISTSIIWCPTFLPNLSIHGRKAQTSASLIQLCKSSGIMLETLTWATLSSELLVVSRPGGGARIVQTDICTAGQQLFVTGAMAMVVRSAVAAKHASTTLWSPRLLRWQLNGTIRRTVVHLNPW